MAKINARYLYGIPIPILIGIIIGNCKDVYYIIMFN